MNGPRPAVVSVRNLGSREATARSLSASGTRVTVGGQDATRANVAAARSGLLNCLRTQLNARARQELTQAGLVDVMEIRAGDARQTLMVSLPRKIDRVPLDGAKGVHLDVLGPLECRLDPGSLFISLKTNYCPHCQVRVREPVNGFLSIPFADDVELSMRTGWKASRPETTARDRAWTEQDWLKGKT